MGSKKVWGVVALVAAILAGLVFLARPERGPADLGGGPPEAAVEGGILVDLDDDVSPATVRSLEARYGIDLKLNSAFSGPEQLYRADVGDRAAELVRELGAEDDVENVEIEGMYRIPSPPSFATSGATTASAEGEAPDRWHFVPNDPAYKYQWHMNQIAMPRAWRLGRGREVTVAVIDTGVAFEEHGDFYRVPDLAGTEMVPGYDFVDDDDHPNDEHGHGTHVSGTIAQTTDNAVGVTGVSPEARIMPLRVLNAQGYGSWGDIADAIRWAADHGANVINMSLGGSRGSKVITDAIEYAHDKGVVVVCAAGNTGRGKVEYPGRAPYSIAVSATRYDESITFYSSWGSDLDVAAPGGDTRVDQNGDGMVDGVLQNTIVPGNIGENDYLAWMGTSMASPHAAGTAALIVANGVTRPDAVEAVLETTARGEGRDPRKYGAGIIDGAAALNRVQLVFGAYKLAIAILMSIFLFLGVKERGIKIRLAYPLGLIAGSAGLFFAPAVLGYDAPFLAWYSRGLPELDMAIFGLAGHGNPLFYSGLAPLALAVIGYAVRPGRALAAGLAVGVAANLVFTLLWGTVAVQWVPSGLGWLWLAGNALACWILARIVIKK
ncbi:MAG: S8 family serine peptidase [Deltaproteobacteria bacterium]|nr:S8 family serine peptidase [Deltaproteobacteria bacterium]